MVLPKKEIIKKGKLEQAYFFLLYQQQRKNVSKSKSARVVTTGHYSNTKKAKRASLTCRRFKTKQLL